MEDLVVHGRKNTCLVIITGNTYLYSVYCLVIITKDTYLYSTYSSQVER